MDENWQFTLELSNINDTLKTWANRMINEDYDVDELIKRSLKHD
jgi:hypothetical protein